jgi:hypothetical protein
MGVPPGKRRPVSLLILAALAIAAFTVFLSILKCSPIRVSAHSPGTRFPACGTATVDGHVNPLEWSSAATQTFQMVSPGSATPFTATLYVMNSGDYLDLG